MGVLIDSGVVISMSNKLPNLHALMAMGTIIESDYPFVECLHSKSLGDHQIGILTRKKEKEEIK